jgi:sarcosine oxidase
VSLSVGVVGAGINGLCTAWALARAGHRATVFDQGPIPNPLSASVDEHRLHRPFYGGDPAYARLVLDTRAAWMRLSVDVGETVFVRTGSLALFIDDRNAEAVRARDTLAEMGEAFEILDAPEIARRWPFLVTNAVRWGLFGPQGGVLLADKAMAGLARVLPEGGVVLRPGAPVADVDPVAGTVRVVGEAPQAFDAVVVAAGAWIPRLMPAYRGRLAPRRVLVAYVEPPARYAEAWTRAPGLHGYGLPSGLWSIPPVAGTRLKLAAPPTTRTEEPDRSRGVSPLEVAALMDEHRGALHAIDEYRVLEARSCVYALNEGERFVAERVGPKGWVLSADSGHGFKFGPLTGELMADALADEGKAARLTDLMAGRG